MITCKHCGAENEAGDSFCQECGKPLVSDAPAGDGLGGLETIVLQPTQPSGKKAPSEDLMLEPGSVFAGRYTIVELIGQGGMGVVYKATETLAGREREIALKLIRADRLGNQSAIDKLISEGALTQDIRHPNVVTVYNVGVSDGQPFVAMEYVEGVSLREWHRRQLNARQEVSLANAAAIVNELLDGLEAAHKLGIVHRDLKPENVVLKGEPGPEGASLEILDFGIARAPGTVDSGTGTGLGTPRYMAPEQITNPDSVQPSADLYSLSVIFYELLMDVLPQGHWQPPSGGRSDVPAAIDGLIERGLANRPASRPQDTAEYRGLLAAALPAGPTPEPDPIPTPGPTPTPTPNIDLNDLRGNPAVRKVALWGGGGLAALVLVSTIAGGFDDPGGGEIIADDLRHLEDNIDDYDDYDDGGGGEVVGGRDTVAPVSYTDLSGNWQISNDPGLNVNVDANGNFAGTGYALDGSPVEIRGSIPAGSYQVGNQMVVMGGSISWNGQGCDLDFTTYNPDGSVNLSGTFHVDHDPSQKNCPARFNR